jgi:hypothetical protein
MLRLGFWSSCRKAQAWALQDWTGNENSSSIGRRSEAELAELASGFEILTLAVT